MTPRDRYLAWRRQLAASAGGCTTCRAVRAAARNALRRVLPPRRPPTR